jgi:hypothetical protein
MATFKGKNSTVSALRLFADRGLYKVEAYSERDGQGPVGVEDFTFAEYNLYGRIDTNMNVVVPKEEAIQTVLSPMTAENQARIMDFLTGPFEVIQRTFKTACRTNIIPAKDPFLSVINAYKGYHSPQEKYQQYLDNALDIFNTVYIFDGNRGKKVKNIKQYVYLLINYQRQMTARWPLTFTAWQKSRNSNIFTSGIALDLSNMEYDIDAKKENHFLNNPTFPFYLNVCKQNGFSVSHQVPWVIVADLDSPALKPYLEDYGLVSPQDIFSSKYDFTSQLDLSILQQSVYKAYNRFVELFPIEKSHDFCSSNKMVTTISRREHYSEISEYSNIINDNVWISLYTNIRNIEENYVFQKNEVARIQRTAQYLTKTLDISASVGYVNEQFRSFFKSKDGGINSIIKRQREKELEKENSLIAQDYDNTSGGAY